jgi:8-oxo-dGTP diphosphatase
LTLRVAAAAVVDDGRLLLVSKSAAPRVFYLPGGKPCTGESASECIRRELREELGAGPASLEFLETVRAVAALEQVPMTMEVFLATLDGEPAPAAEIASLAWYADGKPFHGELAPAIVGRVLPTLRRRSLL